MQLRLGSVSRWYLRHFNISPYARRRVLLTRLLTFITSLLALGATFFGPSTSPFDYPPVLQLSSHAQSAPKLSFAYWCGVFALVVLSTTVHLSKRTFSNAPMNQGISAFAIVTYMGIALWALAWAMGGSSLGLGARGTLGTIVRWVTSVMAVLTQIRIAKGFAPAITWRDYFLINVPYSLLHASILATSLNITITPIGPEALLTYLQHPTTTSILQGYTITAAICIACLILLFTAVSRDALFGIAWGAWNLIQSQRVWELMQILIPEAEGLREGYGQMVGTFGATGLILVVVGVCIALLNVWEIWTKRRVDWRARVTAEKLR